MRGRPVGSALVGGRPLGSAPRGAPLGRRRGSRVLRGPLSHVTLRKIVRMHAGMRYTSRLHATTKTASCTVAALRDGLHRLQGPGRHARRFPSELRIERGRRKRSLGVPLEGAFLRRLGETASRMRRAAPVTGRNERTASSRARAGGARFGVATAARRAGAAVNQGGTARAFSRPWIRRTDVLPHARTREGSFFVGSRRTAQKAKGWSA